MADYDLFVCFDCERLMPTDDAAYNVDAEGERGTRCQKCAAEFEQWAHAWPKREVA